MPADDRSLADLDAELVEAGLGQRGVLGEAKAQAAGTASGLDHVDRARVGAGDAPGLAEDQREQPAWIALGAQRRADVEEPVDHVGPSMLARGREPRRDGLIDDQRRGRERQQLHALAAAEPRESMGARV